MQEPLLLRFAELVLVQCLEGSTAPKHFLQLSYQLCLILNLPLPFLVGGYLELRAIDDARKIARLEEALDEHDDVSDYFSNYEMSDEIIKLLEQET
jgi:hypothetical protein